MPLLFPEKTFVNLVPSVETAIIKSGTGVWPGQPKQY